MPALFEKIVAQYTARLQADLGIKGFQADGIFGNIGHECKGFQALQEVAPVSGVGGYGWAQWTGPRRRAYFAFCSDRPLHPSDPESNYLFLVHESLTAEKASLVALRATRTRDEAVRVWMEKNLRPGVPALEKRIAWAKRAEAARLQAEAAAGKPASQPSEPSEQKGTAMNDTPVPVPADPPPVSASPDPLVDAFARLEKKLEDFAAAKAKSYGVPAVAIGLVETALDKLDLPQRAATAIRNLDVEALIAKAVTSLVSSLEKKVA